MNFIFDLVYRFLVFLSQITGLSYQEINIVVYYILAPFVYFILLDKIFHFHYFKIGFFLLVILLLIFIPDLHSFAYDLFIASQHFLRSFGWLGLDYTGASVVICVLLPLLFFVLLLWLLRKRKTV